MASPMTARKEDEEVDKSTGADMHPQALLTQEFATLTGFIAAARESLKQMRRAATGSPVRLG